MLCFKINKIRKYSTFILSSAIVIILASMISSTLAYAGNYPKGTNAQNQSAQWQTNVRGSGTLQYVNDNVLPLNPIKGSTLPGAYGPALSAWYAGLAADNQYLYQFEHITERGTKTTTKKAGLFRLDPVKGEKKQMTYNGKAMISDIDHANDATCIPDPVDGGYYLVVTTWVDGQSLHFFKINGTTLQKHTCIKIVRQDNKKGVVPVNSISGVAFEDDNNDKDSAHLFVRGDTTKAYKISVPYSLLRKGNEKPTEIQVDQSWSLNFASITSTVGSNKITCAASQGIEYRNGYLYEITQSILDRSVILNKGKTDPQYGQADFVDTIFNKYSVQSKKLVKQIVWRRGASKYNTPENKKKTSSPYTLEMREIESMAFGYNDNRKKEGCLYISQATRVQSAEVCAYEMSITVATEKFDNNMTALHKNILYSPGIFSDKKDTKLKIQLKNKNAKASIMPSNATAAQRQSLIKGIKDAAGLSVVDLSTARILRDKEEVRTTGETAKYGFDPRWHGFYPEYVIKHSQNLKAGTATLTILGVGPYEGYKESVSLTLAQTLTPQLSISKNSATFKVADLKKASKSFSIGASSSNSAGTITYSIVNVNAGKTTLSKKDWSAAMSLDPKTGKLILKKRSSNSAITYKIKVRVNITAKGAYKAATKDYDVTVNVKK